MLMDSTIKVTFMISVLLIGAQGSILMGINCITFEYIDMYSQCTSIE